MALRCGAGCGIAAGWGLLAHGVSGGYCGAAAYSGNWVRAVQAGDGREITGAAVEFFSDEPAYFGRCLCGYSIVGWNHWAGCARGGTDSNNAVEICDDRTFCEKNEATCASLLRGLAESAD